MIAFSETLWPALQELLSNNIILYTFLEVETEVESFVCVKLFVRSVAGFVQRGGNAVHAIGSSCTV